MRLFTAIKLSPGTEHLLTDIQARLREQGVSGNFTNCNNLHITLAFIGEYGRPDAVMKALETVSFEPFGLSVGGEVGCFGELLWVGIPKPKALSSLAGRVRRALEEENIPFDRKPFKPHITIVRRAAFDKDRLSAALNGMSVEKMTVDKISLMDSRRINGRLVYTEIGAVRAKGFV